METIADLYLIVTASAFTLIGIAVFGKDKGERELSKRRATVRTGATNYSRQQAQMATASEVIKKG